MALEIGTIGDLIDLFKNLEPLMNANRRLDCPLE
jgi:hypothetical protein